MRLFLAVGIVTFVVRFSEPLKQLARDYRARTRLVFGHFSPAKRVGT